MNKTVLITGASRGIGRATALEFGKRGYNVAINYSKSEEDAIKTRDEIRSLGVMAEVFRADVSDSRQVKEMFERARQELGEIDILVANAGISVFGLFSETDEETWDRIFDVNVKGAYLSIKEALPHMVSQKSGRIIVVSSMWGLVGASCEVAYSASKSALVGMVKGLAKELGPSGINVNGVAPGLIMTEMNSRLSKEDIDSFAEETPLERAGAPSEVADLICYLALGKGSSFMTGQIISIDGGEVI